MSSQGPEPKPVFTSYSHDSELHCNRVLELADRLRANGINCWVDKYAQAPIEGWPRWMRNQIADAEFVILVCTEVFQERFEGRGVSGQGLGVKWEGVIVTEEIYEQDSNVARFLPLIFETKDERFIPKGLKGATRYNMEKADGYEELYRRLTNQPYVVPETLGPQLILPRRREVNAPDRVTRNELFRLTRRLLSENRIVFDDCGPYSTAAIADPFTAAKDIWDSRKLDTVIPNNQRIIDLWKNNQGLLSDDEYSVFQKFEYHANTFADKSAPSFDGKFAPTFPHEFRVLVEQVASDLSGE